MDYHTVFVSAAAELVGSDIANSLPVPPTLQNNDPIVPEPSTNTTNIVPVCPDDLMSIFRTLRDRNIKFIAPKRISTFSTIGDAPSASVSSSESHDGTIASTMYLSKHTFMRAVICAIDPLLQCDVHIAKRVKQTIDATTIGITSDINGVVKRFRAACGIRQPSAEDMRASLYETNIILMDNHLNDIAIFHMANSLKIGILLTTRMNSTRIIPANMSIHDRAILIKETSDKTFECCSGVSSGTLLQMLKKQMTMKDGFVMPSMKVAEIRAILVDQIGIGAKQASEILDGMDCDNDAPLSKKNMLKIIDVLKSDRA
jgi:hypothetical protein